MKLSDITRGVAKAAIALHRAALHHEHDRVVVRNLEAHATLRQHDELLASMTRLRAAHATNLDTTMQATRDSWQAMAEESAKYPKG
ncbi:MAG TPA: hypothetical protein VM783_17975 [Candidatus Acidoferrum sp.]|nr:hypothetical protein [Candidatus Acidoferrum sp.]